MTSAPTADTYKRAELAKTLTIYGRKPVLEALQDHSLNARTLHWASSNQNSGIARDILAAACARGVEIREHSRETLARISRNGRQDQGVALDILCPTFATADNLFGRVNDSSFRVLALDGITNPQNVGMIIRSAAAGGIDAILYPRRGVAAMGPLVIKASVGTLFKAPIVQCDRLLSTLQALKDAGFSIASMAGDATTSIFDHRPNCATVFVLGGETDGVSAEVRKLCDTSLHIPMKNGVESLNVAVAGSLIAYASRLV